MEHVDALAVKDVVGVPGGDEIDRAPDGAHRGVERLAPGGRFDEGFRRDAPGERAVTSDRTKLNEERPKAGPGCGAGGGHAGRPAPDDDEVPVSGHPLRNPSPAAILPFPPATQRRLP